jgi:hypothetical protein
LAICRLALSRAEQFRPQRLFVEAARVVRAHGKIRAVEHEIALDVAQPLLAQLAQQQPEIFQRELRISSSLLGSTGHTIQSCDLSS